MLRVDRSSLREAGKLYALYGIAGIAAIPAGVAYSLLRIAGLERWWTLLPLLVVGLCMALWAWRYAERWLCLYEGRTDQALASQVQPVMMLRDMSSAFQFAQFALNPAKLPLSFPPPPRSVNYPASLDDQLFAVMRGVGEEWVLVAPQLGTVALSAASKKVRQTEIDIAIPTDKLGALAAGMESPGRTSSHHMLIANQLGGS
jgi:hypothetical protein